MKIRMDFVTNSSSSSFITVKVKSSRLQQMLGLESEDMLNERIKAAIFSLGMEYENGYPFPEDENFSSVAEYVLWILNNYEGYDEEEFMQRWLNGEDIEVIAENDADEVKIESKEISDADLQSLEINHAEFDDGGYGPLEYTKINAGKKLTIRFEETYDSAPYKDEDISGMEFYFIGNADEFQDKKSIERYIQEHDGKITDSISRNTRYAICANFEINDDECNRVRENCIPILSEAAFRYRYIDDTLYDDIGQKAREVDCDWMTVVKWFETYGLGETKIKFWNGNEWITE